ncbi:histone-like nucleoid-structuring protein Lsr2 [Nonomuraea jabiensis]|uniref:Lsr2 dimerization domain-containing protein n=1 Tax=Nonomuraea jabiensis TaxID=882448 RepID=UPI0034237687
MAEKVIRVMIDDLDGTENGDVKRREFEVLSQKFTIDLSDANHKRLEELLEELTSFTDVAVAVIEPNTLAKRSKSTSKLANGHTVTDLRNWAKENNIEVGERKISNDTYEEYYKAFPDARPAE